MTTPQTFPMRPTRPTRANSLALDALHEDLAKGRQAIEALVGGRAFPPANGTPVERWKGKDPFHEIPIPIHYSNSSNSISVIRIIYTSIRFIREGLAWTLKSFKGLVWVSIARCSLPTWGSHPRNGLQQLVCEGWPSAGSRASHPIPNHQSRPPT